MRYPIEKNSIQETLVIPLYGRALCSRKFPHLFADQTAAELLEQKGIHAGVVKLNRVSPLGPEEAAAIGHVKRLLVLEDSFGAGCVGQRLAAILMEAGLAPDHLILKNLGKTYAPEGTVAQLEERFGLDGAGVAAAVEEAMAHEQ